MFPRGESAAEDAHLTLVLCLGDRAPLGLVDFFTGALQGGTNHRAVLCRKPHRSNVFDHTTAAARVRSHFGWGRERLTAMIHPSQYAVICR
jgi:hypothetical protein